MITPPLKSDYPATLVVGLGNPILGDDGVGWRAAEAVRMALAGTDFAGHKIDVDCFALGGLSLMEQLIGYDWAIIIDAVQTASGCQGEVYDLCLEDLPDLSTGHITAAHDMSLQTALKLGDEMGAYLPSKIWIVGIEAERVFDFSEALSPSVNAAVPAAAQLVLAHLHRIYDRAGELAVPAEAAGS